jgi:hypothetical protein
LLRYGLFASGAILEGHKKASKFLGHLTQEKGSVSRYKKGTIINPRHSPDIGATTVKELSVIGTISGPYCGALDDTLARLLSRTEFGNIVELLESKGVFDTGAKVCVEDNEFHPLGPYNKNPQRRNFAFPLIEDSDAIDALRARYIQEWSTGIVLNGSV